MEQFSRREFLKASSTAIPAAAGLTVAQSARASGEDTINIGMIGYHARNRCCCPGPGADRGARLTAMADLFSDRLQASRKSLREKKPDQVAVDDDHCFVGFDAYRKVIDSGVDVVLIANASRFHARHLKACVDAGKHTFVEKPAAIDPPDVKIVLDAAEQAEKKGLSIVSGLMCRYNQGIQETVQRIHDGAIGRVVAIQETTLRANFRLRKRLPGQSEIEYQLYNWTHFSWLSGDFLTASLVHHTDKAGWVMREEQPKTAFGMGGRSCPFGEEHGDCFDHHAVVYEYAGGVMMYACLWVQPGCYSEVSDVVLGSKGRANLMKHRIEGQTNWRYHGPNANPYQIEQNELLASVRKGQPINNGRYMALSTMTGVLGQIACYTGKKVTWDEALAAGNVFGPADCDFSTEPPIKPDADGTYPVRVPGIAKLT